MVKPSAQLTSKTTIPKPVFEQPDTNLTPDWSVLLQLPTPSKSILLRELGRAKAFSNVLESCLETSNAQLILAHLKIAKLQTALQEVKLKSKRKNSRAKLMSSGMARLLTSNEFREAVRKDEAVVQEKLTAQEIRAQKTAIKKAKTQWRARDIADRKRQRAEQLADHQRRCRVAEMAGERKLKVPKAPT